MGVEEAVEHIHRQACRGFGMVAENPALKALSLPFADLSAIAAANTVLSFVQGAKRAERLKNAVQRCRAARRPIRPRRKLA